MSAKPGEQARGPWTVVATGATLVEADLLCALLRAHYLDAVVLDQYAINTLIYVRALAPCGVRIAVTQDQAEAAAAVLRTQWSRPDAGHSPDRESPARVTADDYAYKAWLATAFTLFFPPILLLAPFLMLRAVRTARAAPPADPKGYRRNLRRAGAVLLVVLLALCLAFPLARMLSLLVDAGASDKP